MENEVKKINKNKGAKLGIVLFAVLACGTMIGCGFSKSALADATDVPTYKPVATQQATPTPTFTPEPSSTPKPTHQPDLSLEEERALLGVKNENEIFVLDTLSIMCYTQKGKNNEDITKIAWIFVGMDTKGNHGVYSGWNDEIKLYSVEDADGKITPDEVVKNAEYSNLRMKGSKIISITSLFTIEKLYQKMGIEWDMPEEMQEILALPFSKQTKYEISMSDCMNLYIACTPKEYRTSWKDFDETLILNTPTPTTTVDPTAFRPYTSKDGAANINSLFNKANTESNVVDDNVIHGYRNPNYYNSGLTVDKVNKYIQTQYTKSIT